MISLLGLGLGLETSGLGLGLGLETPGLGLDLEAFGLGLGLEAFGLGLGLETPGLVNIPGLGYQLRSQKVEGQTSRSPGPLMLTIG